MPTLGVFVRVQGGAYVAGFAVVDGTALLREDRFPAPPDEDGPRQLAELYKHTSDTIEHFGVEAVALKESEIQHRGATATLARRAEGAVLSAAGEVRGLEITTWLGAGMWRLAGLERRLPNDQVMAALAGTVQPATTSDEARQAAAAARAAIVVRG